MKYHFIFFRELYTSLYIYNGFVRNPNQEFDYEFGKTHFLSVYKLFKKVGIIVFDEIYFDYYLLLFLTKIKEQLIDQEEYEYTTLTEFLIKEITFSLIKQKMFIKLNGEFQPHPYLKTLDIDLDF
jgi:hypothetical protein